MKTKVWLEISKSLAPSSKAFAAMPGLVSLLATYAFLLVVTGLGAAALRLKIGTVRPGLHRDLLAQLLLLDPRQLRLYRGHARQA